MPHGAQVLSEERLEAVGLSDAKELSTKSHNLSLILGPHVVCLAPSPSQMAMNSLEMPPPFGGQGTLFDY